MEQCLAADGRGSTMTRCFGRGRRGELRIRKQAKRGVREQRSYVGRDKRKTLLSSIRFGGGGLVYPCAEMLVSLVSLRGGEGGSLKVFARELGNSK